jgi:hypothetical protein
MILRILLIISLIIIFYLSGFCFSIVNELTPDKIKETDSLITVSETDDLVTFKYRWPNIRVIPEDDDTIYAVPPNTFTELIIKDKNQIIFKSSVGVSPGYGQPYFYFEVAKEFLDSSTFTVTIYHSYLPSMDRWWFNLKEMYEGLINK